MEIMTPSLKYEIIRVEADIKNLKNLKKTVKFGFLSKSLPLQLKAQKRLLKQLKTDAIKTIINNK